MPVTAHAFTALTWDVLLGVQQVVIKGVLLPVDGCLLVGLAVGETCSCAGGSAKQATEVGALLVAASLLRYVTLLGKEKENQDHYQEPA